VTTISSQLTFVHKRVLPVVLFGGLAVALLVAVINAESWPSPYFLGVGVAIGAFWLLMMRLLVWRLVDEVEDHGDYLVVRNRDEQERIPLANISRVSGTMMVNPPQVTLRLVTPGKFGNEVKFTPAMRFRFNPFAKPLIVEELRARVDRARQGRPPKASSRSL
jgi:hypothetical protein